MTMRILQTTSPRVQRKCGCTTGGDCGCGGKKKVQMKRRDVSEPHDPLEVEADRAADAAMSGNAAQLTPHEASVARTATNAAPSPLPADLASSAGTPMPDAHRRDFESRFDHDFSRVRIHDDSTSHALASSYAARAFTYGTDVFFGAGQLDLHGSEGRRLLAHELAHTVQQSAGDVVHRAVMKDYAKLKKLLSYSFTDWKIFDSEAHAALEMLQALGDADLTDTVAQMEKDGVVDHLFENVPDEDKFKYDELLQKVQTKRVHKVQKGDRETTVVDSCTPDERAKVVQMQNDAIGWLTAAAARIGSYVGDPKAHTAVGEALERHFHASSEASAQRVQARLTWLAMQINGGGVSIHCAAPTDPSCEKTAAAYVRSSASLMRLCPGVFEDSTAARTELFVHESAHAYLKQVRGTKGVTDRAYRSERVYSFLSEAEALDNADSYSELVKELVSNKPGKGRERTDVSDCSVEQVAQARRAVAWAERWTTTARQSVYDSRPRWLSGWADLRKKYFSADDDKVLPDIRKRLDAADEKFTSDVSVECERGGICDEARKGTVTTGYYRYFIARSGTLHVCPAFFTLDEQNQITEMLTLAVMNSTGLPEPQAEKYAFLARDLSARYWPAPPSVD